MSGQASRGRARAWWLVAFAPVLLIFYGNWCFIANHFAVAPYLHDSGWFASIVFREGIMPRNPASVANDIAYYWGWHISPLVSAGSLVSYAYPGGLVDWYGVFQGLVYAPLGIAVPMLVRAEWRRGAMSAVVVAGASLAFAFSGQVLSAVGFPHFEIFASAGLAIMLAALASGRESIAWVGLAMAVATREDGGFHAASMLAAVLAAGLLGRPFPIARRRLVTMMVVAFGITLAATSLQKRFFVTPNAWEVYLVGKPPFAHLSWPVIGQRVRAFFALTGFVWAPVLATLVIAVVRRDPRYLLGWVATVPWFLLNFTAKQDVKSQLAIYTGFPFVGSAFWVGAYARARAGDKAPLQRVVWPVAAVSLASLAGLVYSSPHSIRWLAPQMLVRPDVDHAAMRAYANALEANPSVYGRLLLDSSAAAWTVKSATRAALVADGREPSLDVTRFDGVTFFDHGLLSPTLPALLARGRYTSCGGLPRTPMMFCARETFPLPPGFRPASVMARSLELTVRARRDLSSDRIEVLTSPTPEVATFGPFLSLAPGAYEVTFDAQLGECPAETATSMFVEVLVGRRVLALRRLERGTRSFVVPFAVEGPGALDRIEVRFWSGECGYAIERLALSSPERERAK